MDDPLPFDPALTCVNYNDETQPDKKIICPECGKSYPKSLFSEHMEIHTEQKPFKCDKCDKTFAAKSYLVKHAKIHSLEKQHVCPQCRKGFGQRKHLEQHLLTHTAEKRFKCPICPKKFNQKVHLNRHKIIHKSRLSQPKVNPEFRQCHLCLQTFSYKVCFKRHMLIHAGEKSFNCTEENCTKSFIRNDALQQHVKLVHSRIKEFKCDVCDLEFGHKSNLVTHMKTHVGNEDIESKEKNENWIMEIPAIKSGDSEVKGKRGRKRKTKENEPNNLHQVFLVENEHFDPSEMSNDILELENYEKEKNNGLQKNSVDYNSICKNKLLAKEELVFDEIEHFNKSIIRLYPEHRNWVISSFVQELDISKQIAVEKRGKDYWKFKCFPVLEAGNDSEKERISWELQPENLMCSDLFYPSCIKYIIQVFKDFLDNVSEEQEHVPKNGELMYIEMQVNYTDEVMVLVTAHNCDETIKESLKNYLSHHDDDVNIWLDPENEWNLKSLHYQTSQSKSELLYGVNEVYIKFDELKIGMSMNIRSSLGSSSLKLLTDSIANYLEPCQRTSLVEFGCGGGQIGLLLASKFGRVFGIDTIFNVKEATQMCLNNNVSKVFYVQDKLTSIEKMFKILQNDEKVVLILHQNSNRDWSPEIMEKLKALKPLRHVVLVTEFPGQSFALVKTLVNPNERDSFGPFMPTNCCVVDTKPGENGFHSVMLLERVAYPETFVPVKREQESCDDVYFKTEC